MCSRRFDDRKRTSTRPTPTPTPPEKPPSPSLAVLLNAGYATPRDDDVRVAYRETVERVEARRVDGRPVWRRVGPRRGTSSGFRGRARRNVLGGEGCTQYRTQYAPKTFEMVEDFNAGRARCTTQGGDDEKMTQFAIELCFVDCVSWVGGLRAVADKGWPEKGWPA
jgi:ferredoxin